MTYVETVVENHMSKLPVFGEELTGRIRAAVQGAVEDTIRTFLEPSPGDTDPVVTLDNLGVLGLE
jgi:hypothetical protein